MYQIPSIYVYVWLVICEGGILLPIQIPLLSYSQLLKD